LLCRTAQRVVESVHSNDVAKQHTQHVGAAILRRVQKLEQKLKQAREEHEEDAVRLKTLDSQVATLRDDLNEERRNCAQLRRMLQDFAIDAEMMRIGADGCEVGPTDAPKVYPALPVPIDDSVSLGPWRRAAPIEEQGDDEHGGEEQSDEEEQGDDDKYFREIPIRVDATDPVCWVQWPCRKRPRMTLYRRSPTPP